MHMHPFPEPDSPDLESCMLYSRAEILAILRRLADQRTLVTVYTDGDSEFAVSMVLQVDPDFDVIDFDMPADAQAQARVLAARELVFVIFLENIKVQFRADVAKAVRALDGAAFRVRLPAQLLRLQRREYFRVRTPVGARPTCLVPQSDGATKYESVQLTNISVGGLAAMTYPRLFDLPVGCVVHDCYLNLPGIGTIQIAFRVVNLYAADADHPSRRFGCEFVDLSTQARMMIQRYVNRMEAEQRKAALGAAH
jgi:c-di-GMP-binding flagellar brake protein YcgR